MHLKSNNLKKQFTLNTTGSERIVQKLIENGANINGVNNEKDSALNLAIKKGKKAY